MSRTLSTDLEIICYLFIVDCIYSFILVLSSTCANIHFHSYAIMFLNNLETCGFHRDSGTNVHQLANHHVTHVLNANHSKRRDGAETYLGMNIKYFGIEAHDSCNFDMSVNFQTAADFIHRALSEGGEWKSGPGACSVEEVSGSPDQGLVQWRW